MSMDEWLETPLGRYLIEREQAYFDQVVADIFGFNALQLGLLQCDLLRTNRMPVKFGVAPVRRGQVKTQAEPEGLPFAGQCIDLLLLPHVLEFSRNPHQILREAERVLMPEGQVIISGFNPFSLWGLPRYLPAHKRGYPWCGNFISLLRIKDWLALLGFEVVAGRMCCYAPPLRSEQWLARFSFMEAAGDRWWALAGGVYFLQAKKKVAGMHLITPNWNRSAAAKKALAPLPQKSMNKTPSTQSVAGMNNG
ncbi:MAG: class I SAM-dependent methyltransferase [Betaproteobacteria bacterium]